jgi:hypothetical protein
VLESSIDRLGRPVARAGPVEVGEHVVATLLQRSSGCDQLAERSRDAVAEGLDELDHERASAGAVGFAVGGDHLLVDGRGRLDLDVLIGREQCEQAVLLLAGKQVGTGMQGPPGPARGGRPCGLGGRG